MSLKQHIHRPLGATERHSSPMMNRIERSSLFPVLQAPSAVSQRQTEATVQVLRIRIPIGIKTPSAAWPVHGRFSAKHF